MEQCIRHSSGEMTPESDQDQRAENSTLLIGIRGKSIYMETLTSVLSARRMARKTVPKVPSPSSSSTKYRFILWQSVSAAVVDWIVMRSRVKAWEVERECNHVTISHAVVAQTRNDIQIPHLTAIRWGHRAPTSNRRSASIFRIRCVYNWFEWIPRFK